MGNDLSYFERHFESLPPDLQNTVRATGCRACWAPDPVKIARESFLPCGALTDLKRGPTAVRGARVLAQSPLEKYAKLQGTASDDFVLGSIGLDLDRMPIVLVAVVLNDRYGAAGLVGHISSLPGVADGDLIS